MNRNESSPDTYGFINLSNAEHKKAKYVTVDQENGCIYIDIPVTEWKDANGGVVQGEPSVPQSGKYLRILSVSS